MTNLKGHSKKITGLAFSQVLNVLVSSGADDQVSNLSCAAFLLGTLAVLTMSHSYLI